MNKQKCTCTETKTQKGGYVDVQEVLSEHGRTFVRRLSGAVEDPSEHVLGNGELHDVAGELAARVACVDASGALEDLHNSLVLRDFQDLPTTHRSIAERDVDDLAVARFLKGERWCRND